MVKKTAEFKGGVGDKNCMHYMLWVKTGVKKKKGMHYRFCPRAKERRHMLLCIVVVSPVVHIKHIIFGTGSIICPRQGKTPIFVKKNYPKNMFFPCQEHMSIFGVFEGGQKNGRA